MTKKFNPHDKRWCLMCPDPDQAAENRARVKSGFGATYWLWLAAVIASTPRNKPLPSCIPVDDRVYISALDKPKVGRGTIDMDEEYIEAFEKGVQK
jgi:hypothetical protein